MDKPSMRKQFCEYAKTSLSHLRIFLAESAQKDYVKHLNPEFNNVAEFEDIIAEISTCVILFPESAGSFTELGYFSRNRKLRKKLLVVNNAALQGQDSFLALGPIKLIDRDSNFQSTIQLQYTANPNFDLVTQRLKQRIPSQYRRRFIVGAYADLSPQAKLYFVFELLVIFGAMTVDGIEYAFRSVWGRVNRKELHRLLSILVAADYAQRCGEEMDYFRTNHVMPSFLEFERLDIVGIKLGALDLYERNYPDIAKVVRGQVR